MANKDSVGSCVCILILKKTFSDRNSLVIVELFDRISIFPEGSLMLNHLYLN